MEDRLVRWFDLLRMPLSSLAQQKLRTCLTTLGVVVGAFVLAASLSIDEGVQLEFHSPNRAPPAEARIWVKDSGPSAMPSTAPPLVDKPWKPLYEAEPRLSAEAAFKTLSVSRSIKLSQVLSIRRPGTTACSS